MLFASGYLLESGLDRLLFVCALRNGMGSEGLNAASTAAYNSRRPIRLGVRDHSLGFGEVGLVFWREGVEKGLKGAVDAEGAEGGVGFVHPPAFFVKLDDLPVAGLLKAFVRQLDGVAFQVGQDVVVGCVHGSKNRDYLKMSGRFMLTMYTPQPHF